MYSFPLISLLLLIIARVGEKKSASSVGRTCFSVTHLVLESGVSPGGASLVDPNQSRSTFAGLGGPCDTPLFHSVLC